MGHRCERSTFTCVSLVNLSLVCRSVEKSCSSPQCFNGGVCVNTAASFKCICPIDYEGQRCDLSNHRRSKADFDADALSALLPLAEWNDCNNHACQHGSTCVDAVASYTCQCANGFTGKYCEISTSSCARARVCDADIDHLSDCLKDVDDCRIDSCLNNGTCIDLVRDYRCQCLPGFTGRMCQHDLRKCNDTLCRNLGTCYLGFDGLARCNCNQIYTGVFCETRE